VSLEGGRSSGGGHPLPEWNLLEVTNAKGIGTKDAYPARGTWEVQGGHPEGQNLLETQQGLDWNQNLLVEFPVWWDRKPAKKE
jgi:putative NADPH-quinone reductase